MTILQHDPSATTFVNGPSRESRSVLIQRFEEVRRQTETLCLPLTTEDYIPQSMPDASPAKWHLAHVSWFFETFVLKTSASTPSEYAYLFNSYYNALGERVARHQRGLLTRPTVAEVYRYRSLIDEQVVETIENTDEAAWYDLVTLLTLGLNHEQQHQELIVTDIKHLYANNPIRPVYRPFGSRNHSATKPARWIEFECGLREIGHPGSCPGAFAFDNESPRHKVYQEPYQLADRLATNAEYLAFIDDGGYSRPEFWLSEGWSTLQREGWTAPLYWLRDNGSNARQSWTLGGQRAIDPNEPVCHVSHFEADAFARWSGARLPTEAEWELAAEALPVAGNLLESEMFHPVPIQDGGGDGLGMQQAFGDVWEWTQSQYTPYPGFRASAGAIGEYNGKFMCNQHVLRGGSCATPRSHIRASYRNFFPANARWQFSGVRLARDLKV